MIVLYNKILIIVALFVLSFKKFTYKAKTEDKTVENSLVGNKDIQKWLG